MNGGEVSTISLGGLLARRLLEQGVKHLFTVPGDYCMTLLDELLRDGKLQLVGCCNELNAGYAADGYARSGAPLGVLVGTGLILFLLILV